MSNETTERRHVIPPAVQAARMQRYSLYLLVCSFLLVGANYNALTVENVLWFAAGLSAAFALLCAIAVVILHGIAWNFDRRHRTWSALTGCFIWFGVTACGDSTGPTEFDPLAADSIVTNLLNTAEQNQSVQSLSVLGSKLNIPAAGAAARSAQNTSGVLPILDPGLGRTLVFNSATDAYEFDLSAPDVAANEVRFMLYDVNTSQNTVVVPLVELGNLDLSDESAGTAAILGVSAATGAASDLAYTSTASGNFIVATLTHSVSGAIGEGVGAIEIDLTQTISSAEGLNLDYRLTTGSGVVRVELDLDALTTIATTTVTVQYGTTTFAMTASGTPQAIQGDVTVDGGKVANIEGTATTPLFTDTNNRPITGSSLSALLSLFSSPDRLFKTIDDALSPSYWVFGLTIIFGN